MAWVKAHDHGQREAVDQVDETIHDYAFTSGVEGPQYGSEPPWMAN
jgi:hypothetical protein